MKDETLIVTAGRDPERHFGAVNVPVVRTSTVLYPTVADLEERRNPSGMTYGRGGTPTTFALERAMAALEGGAGATVVGSGKAAVVLTLTALTKAGDHLLMVDSAYAPTRAYCDQVLTRFGVETTYYDPLIGAGIKALIRPNTRIVFCESPGSLTFEVQDVPAIAEAAHRRGALVCLDNTWGTPLLFKAFEHGVDVSIHAGTKYIGGHSDIMIGIVTAATETLHGSLRAGLGQFGAPASPDDCYLALRGLRTLSVRLERHQANALELATWLRGRPEVARVLCPALDDDPGHELWKRDFRGACGLFGVVLQPCSEAAVAAMLDGLELFGMGYSWGGYESLIIPTQPGRYRTATTWRAEGPSLRVHAGLEDPEDLIADLERGFARLRAHDAAAAK